MKGQQNLDLAVTPRSIRAWNSYIRWFANMPRLRAWLVTLLSLLVVLLVEILTPVSGAPLYILAICLPAWVLGQRMAFIAAGISLLGTAAIHSELLYPMVHAVYLWELAMQAVSLSILIMLMSGFRYFYNIEWRRARSDGLTGALNRQGFFEQVSASYPARPWGLLIYVDLDGFKQVNDRFSHAEGDAVLRSFASGVRLSLTPIDTFARVGGDEFLLYVPVSDQNQAYRRAARLQQHMRYVLEETGLDVSCSIGALIVKPGFAGIGEADVGLADRLMYEAKTADAVICIATKKDMLVKDGAHESQRPAVQAAVRPMLHAAPQRNAA